MPAFNAALIVLILTLNCQGHCANAANLERASAGAGLLRMARRHTLERIRHHSSICEGDNYDECKMQMLKIDDISSTAATAKYTDPDVNKASRPIVNKDSRPTINKASQPINSNIRRVAPPINDDAANAVPIASGDIVNYTTVDATYQAGEPGLSGIRLPSSIWYEFDVLLRTSEFDIEIIDADYDTFLALFQATNTSDFSTFSLIASDDDGGPDLLSRILACNLSPGQYLIQVRGILDSFGQGLMQFTATAETETVPPNDDPENAAPIALGDTVDFATSTATSQVEVPNLSFGSVCFRSIWYEFNIVSPTNVLIETINADYNTFLALFQATNNSEFSTFSLIASDDNGGPGLLSRILACNLSPGQHLIQVRGYVSNAGEGTMSIASIPYPINDDVLSAEPLPFDVSTSFNSVCGTVEANEPSPGAGTGVSSCNALDGWCSFETNVQNSLWYSFQSPATSVCLSVEAGGPIDTQLALWQTDDPSDFTTFVEVAANDDSDSGSLGNIFNARIEKACSTPNTNYLIQLDGFAGQSTGAGIVILEDEDPTDCPERCCPVPTQGVLNTICLDKAGRNFACLNHTDVLMASSVCGSTQVTPIAYSEISIDPKSMNETVIRSNITISSIDVNTTDTELSFVSENCKEDLVFFDEAHSLICFQPRTIGKNDAMYTIEYAATDKFNRMVVFENQVHVPHGAKGSGKSSSSGSGSSPSASGSKSKSSGKSPKSSSSSAQGVCAFEQMHQPEHKCIKATSKSKSGKSSSYKSVKVSKASSSFRV